jgi:hypothetical protein
LKILAVTDNDPDSRLSSGVFSNAELAPVHVFGQSDALANNVVEYLSFVN